MISRRQPHIRLITFIGFVVVLLSGCLQQPSAAPTAVAPTKTPIMPAEALNSLEIRIEPIQLPKGYVAVGAVGDTLILSNIGQKDTDSLVLYEGGQVGIEIARQSWNTMVDFASDDRWFSWCEAKNEMEKKLTDPWKIWAWDSVTRKVRQIAQEAPKAEGDMREIGPRIRMSDGRVLWRSVNPSTKKVQLNMFDLRTDDRRIVADYDPSAPLGGYDIYDLQIAYGLGNKVVVISGADTKTITAETDVGEVLVTADGVAWAGDRLMSWNDARGTKALPCGSANRWWFSSTDHYITWLEAASGNALRILHTPSGTEHVVVETDVINGGFVFGKYVAWTQYGDGQSIIGMIAKLP